MKTPIVELFEKFGHLLPDVENEYLEKEKQAIEEAVKKANLEGKIEMADYYNKKYKK